MKGQAALLLVLLVATASATTAVPPSTEHHPSTSARTTTASNTTTAVPSTTAKLRTTKMLSTNSEVSSILDVDPKDILVQNMRSEDEDTNNEKIQEELAKVIKAQAKKTTKPAVRVPLIKSNPIAADHGAYNATESQKMQKLIEAEDIVYTDEGMDDGDDDDEDEYDEDDDDEDDDDEDDIDDDEEIMTGCPDYCRCVGQYAAATTARCSKLLEDQGFSSGIAHLKIENAGDIRLGPHALRKLGLRQLESISIVDTRIVELDRTAFDGLRELFVVNLTRNGLTYIHPDTFQNNSQLSLLTVANNPLKLANRRGSNEFLLDAPSVTELDFSGNQLNRLPRRAFAKMTNLAYISLKNNRLNNIEKDLFSSLDSLVELDLSHNLLSDLPVDLFKNKNLQSLRISGNSLTTLSTIRASKLTVLDASMNRLKVIAKEDLNGVPYLDQLYLSANNLKRIHQHAFSNLDQLTYLDLSQNNLVTLSEHHFRTNARLQVLLLNDNPDLETLPVFRTNAQEFERYSIYRFECEDCGLTFIESGTFDAMPAMTRLNLARNKLSSLPKDLLRSLSSLRELDLSMNSFDKLEDDMFEGATSLTKLNLALNSFESGLRVTPFLKTPNLMRLDVSMCGMLRVWNEARLPFTSLKYLSLHKNRLSRVTVEELRAMPHLSGLDLTRNPLRCDEDLSAAIQWLTDNNVTPTDSTRTGGSLKYDYDYRADGNADADAVSQWSDLGKKLCDSWEGGPPPRPAPKKPKKTLSAGVQVPLAGQDSAETGFPSLPGPFIKFDFSDDVSVTDNKIDFGQGHSSKNEEIESAWNSEDQEYEELANMSNVQYREWYTDALWPVVTVVLVTLAVLLLAAHFAICLAKRRGRGPVIRTPMILRPGLVDSKNCGLVYKPLQEEIATPHMPKRGSFYSSSTFHYDKIVPESV